MKIAIIEDERLEKLPDGVRRYLYKDFDDDGVEISGGEAQKIAVFHEGRLVQLGSHEELVKDTEGKYYEMWNAQAKYYQAAEGNQV